MTHPVDEAFLAFQSAVAGRYSLERELGRGGMGIVYLAREVRLDRPVAIKLLPPGTGATSLRERFLREARMAARLSHPHVVPIYAVEELDPFVFFAMAFVEGHTLAARVRQRGPLPPSEAARMLREVAWALAHAHEQGVIHRDVKPDNILLEHATGRALVADFGIAGHVQDAATLDGGQIAGTPEFMSPEQALGRAVDPRSDLYSLGAVGYFALSGHLPFQAPTVSQLLARVVTETAPPLTTVAPAVPRRLAHLVDQCLAKDPAQRPPSAAHLGEQLARTIEQRKELPVPLRAFVKHDARLDGAIWLVFPIACLVAAAGVGALLDVTAGYVTLVGTMVGTPLAILGARARRLLRIGFQHSDLDVAFKTEIARGLEERTFGTGLGPTVLERVLKVLNVTAFGTGAVSLVMTWIAGNEPIAWGAATAWFLNAGVIISLGQATLLQRRRDIDTAFWARLWTGRIGRWLFGAARALLPKHGLPAAMTHRPTELVIAMAAEQLFDDLPRELKRGLGDLPDVVGRLEADARRIRARLEELNDAITDVGDAGTATSPETARIMTELRAERDRLQDRLGEAVTALETIRLSLLHLHAGKGGVDSLTTNLDRARSLASGVRRLLEGAGEVERLLRPGPASAP